MENKEGVDEGWDMSEGLSVGELKVRTGSVGNLRSRFGSPETVHCLGFKAL